MWRVGYFSQFSSLDDDLTVQQVCEAVFADIRQVEARLDALSTRLADPDVSESEMEQGLTLQAELLDEMETRGGWGLPGSHRDGSE